MSGLSKFSAVPEGRSFTLRGMERTPFALMQQCPPGSVETRCWGQASKLIRSPNSYRVSNSTGGLPWQAPCNRRLLYQSTHAAVATSTFLILCHGPRGLINSVLYKPISDSAKALSRASPTVAGARGGTFARPHAHHA